MRAAQPGESRVVFESMNNSATHKGWRALVLQNRGQAFVELSLVTVILCILVLGAVDYGNQVSISARLITAARTGALELTPPNTVYSLDTYPTNAFNDIIRSSTDANSAMSANVAGQAVIIISYITYNKTANSGNGSLFIRAQYFRNPGGGNGSNGTYASKLGANGSTINSTATTIPKDVLVTSTINSSSNASTDGDWLTYVEIFYPNPLGYYKKFLSGSNTTTGTLYETAIY